MAETTQTAAPTVPTLPVPDAPTSEFTLELVPDWQKRVEKESRKVSFFKASQVIADSQKDGGQSDPQMASAALEQLKLAVAMFGDDGYKKLEEHFDGDLPDMLDFTISKLNEMSANQPQN